MKRVDVKIKGLLISLNGLSIKLRVISSVLMFLTTYLCINAESLTTHYIVAFDRSVELYQSDYINPRILHILNRLLKDNNYNSEQDYVSMIGYSIEMSNPSIERFTRPYRNVNGEEMIWKKINDTNLSSLFPTWPKGQPILDPNALPSASLQSLSKPYAVMETSINKDSVMNADRTILLVVSDDVVNGTDDNYAQEWNRVATTSTNYHRFNELRKNVFSTMEKFNEEFKFIHIGLKYGNSTRDNISISEDGIYKITPYEVVSAERPSIHSVTDFPVPLPLQRVRGGFRLNIETGSLNTKYLIRDISISNADGKQLGVSNDGVFDIELKSEDVTPGDTLNIAMSLFLKDGLYNASIISADNPRYSDGMRIRQVIRLQEETKVLGLVPLSDSFWWWYPDDIFTAVMIWDLIILICLIGFVAFILYRWFIKIITYIPENKNLKITKI
ncbi:MAG: hypothetical protein K2H47_05855 [Muribaculaceae bacterium]|nr:hypothetical protein [Muribaculaceae bacterium]